MVAFLLIGIGVVALAHIAPFPFVIDVLSPARSIWHGPSHLEADTPVVYLTFDDGAGKRRVGRIGRVGRAG